MPGRAWAIALTKNQARFSLDTVINHRHGTGERAPKWPDSLLGCNCKCCRIVSVLLPELGSCQPTQAHRPKKHDLVGPAQECTMILCAGASCQSRAAHGSWGQGCTTLEVKSWRPFFVRISWGRCGPFTVTVCFKQPEMKLVPEAWRILPSGQELLPVHVAQYQERVPRNGMEFGFVWL